MAAPKGNKFAIGNKGGRPTDYSNDILIKTEGYIKQAVDGLEKQVESINEKTGRKRFINKAVVKLPSIAGLCVYLGVGDTAIFDWANRYKEFSVLLDKIKKLQEERLLNKGISGEYNSTITKLILTKHGYSDRQEVEHSGSVSLGKLFEDAKQE